MSFFFFLRMLLLRINLFCLFFTSFSLLFCCVILEMQVESNPMRFNRIQTLSQRRRSLNRVGSSIVTLYFFRASVMYFHSLLRIDRMAHFSESNHVSLILHIIPYILMCNLRNSLCPTLNDWMLITSEVTFMEVLVRKVAFTFS